MNSSIDLSTKLSIFVCLLITTTLHNDKLSKENCISFIERPNSVNNSDLNVQVPDDESGLGTSSVGTHELSLDAPD
ncbi:hypothetical protein, partial [Acinetobacter baumannii]|uniref:hypothetical protein n=1 Tax=Acinetobacter baumannii TaxID=470 RepID=UPI001A7E4182